MKLVLLRHGESQWNLENRFTGWEDVELTNNGINEAKFAANQILKENIQIESIYTSILKRSIQTAEIVSRTIGFDIKNIQNDWRLNERHYGALQGLNKSETAFKFGEKQVEIWRRSFDTPPPILDNNDNHQTILNDKFVNFNPQDFPSGESLKMVIERIKPFWNKYFNFIESDKSHLIVAHSNSLRAIIKILDNLSDLEIISVNIPTGVPLVYIFDEKKNLVKKKYLLDHEELLRKQKLILEQGKV